MQRVSLVLAAAVTPEMRALAEEVEEFYTVCKQIDRLLSAGKTVGAQRKLRALIKGVLASESDQTPRYLAEIYQRWGHLADVDSPLETYLATCAITKWWIDLIRFKFRRDPAALTFISEFESSCKQIDLGFSGLDPTYPVRNLLKSVWKCPYRHVIRRRGLDAHLLDAMESRYGHLINIDRYIRKLAEAERLANKEIPIPFDQGLEKIRLEFRRDRIATDFIFYFTVRITYIECRLAEDELAAGRAALMELVRAIVERCSDEGKFRWQLLGLLSTQYQHVLDVRQEAFRLLDEINCRTDAKRANG